MTKVFDAAEVAKHSTAESCWVVLYGNVYDVTDFIPSHPGGSRVILQLAGRDCTAEFDPIHPPGTLDELKPEAKLGTLDVESIKVGGGDDDKSAPKDDETYRPPPLESLLNLDEMETVATKLVPRKAWSYYFSAGDDLLSKRLNHTVFQQILLRPRVFVDMTACSTTTTLLGGQLAVGLPVFVSPAAMARLGHPDGEAGIARGVSRFGALQIVSHNASMTVEQIVADALPGQLFGWQIYVQKDRRKSEAMLARINGLSQYYRCVVLTLDASVPGKREDDERQQFGTGASFAAATQDVGSQPAGAGIGRQMFFGTATDITWQTTLPWLAAHTSLPIVLKGIQTHEDAWLAARYAAAHPGSVQAIILSNHGGRSLDTAPPAIHTLLEIRKYCPAVFDHVEVWIDGGVHRGTDVVKALCLGAKAVGVGRAALWGLGAGGWRGVDRTFEILSDEIKTCMRLLGATSIADLNPRLVNTRAVERDIFDGGAGLNELGLLPVKAKI
ncbi:mitochondrial fmn-dependent dehydrogenase [Grosmannia clavigera kw1407]|uniref:L-lactate dehydrogenase (cytochrome) n=1 Tax=Grosmannia clavigera (strain kw1407 / UAMH 11150) TaxID=655863 RepID=F0XSB7_GROCL|nr:mitochondrial fmn-dependent dehydrogenase [Grosmannia clavigera kw1407]EFW99487.1 mitochondrial fmn-dependent dehydrogenase [Grosmannia clavigera kw1407]